jgi:glutamyl-tRNA reductase
VLEAVRIREAMRERPDVPMVIIDIAMPRNVEAGAADIRGVVLYNIDDLMEISSANRRQREAEMLEAEGIIRADVDKFVAWWQDIEIKPIISALVARGEDVRLTQLRKVLKTLPPLTPEQRESLEAMTRSIAGRILEDPIRFLKTKGNGAAAEMIKKLFRLNAGGRS